MRLTVKIRKATDGCLDLQVLELPELEVSVTRVGEIQEAVSSAAEGLTGRARSDFDVEIGY